ncbi:MAG: DedA family protein [Streptosporangiales bacterium]|nr:DedA family protein [Streptosporangiales bacterium]
MCGRLAVHERKGTDEAADHGARGTVRGARVITPLDLLADAGAATVAWVAGLFVAMETSLFVGLLVPGDVVAVLAGAAIDSPAAAVLVYFAVVVGALAGESGGYLIGRALGPRLRKGRAAAWIGDSRWRRAERLASGSDGGIALLTARFVPFMHSLVPAAAGALRMPYRRFLAWEALAAAIWSAVYLTAGAVAGAALRDAGPFWQYAWGAFVVLLVLAIRWVRKRLRSRRTPVPATAPPLAPAAATTGPDDSP